MQQVTQKEIAEKLGISASAVIPRTFEGIIRNFKLHIEPQIGNMKIYDIDTFVIQKLINNLMDQNYSNNTIKKNKHLIG